jgi:hypothetical protein
LDVKVWELASVPFHWRNKARIVNAGRKEALMEMAKRSGATVVYVLDI